MTPASLTSLKTNHSTLSCLLHPETGGIVDDTVITRLGPDSFYLVTNAACREKDLTYISAQITALPESLSGKLEWNILENQGLLALQGPLSVNVLQDALAGQAPTKLESLYFGQCTEISIRLSSGEVSPRLLVSRGGYTGEDGFEISIPPAATIAIAETLLELGGQDRIRLAGLGARDSLRLEAGMCLYGHDLDDTTTPVEAGLSWVIGQDRRSEGGFHGSDTILQQLKAKKEGGTGVSRRRIGMIVQGAPAREGAQILGQDNQPIGKVTSGCPSPTLDQNIAMGYVGRGYTKIGTKLQVLVRGKQREAEVVKMPFVASRYWKQPTGTAPA